MGIRKSAPTVPAKKNAAPIPTPEAPLPGFPFDLPPKAVVALQVQRLLATRTARGWSFPRGKESKLLPRLRGTMKAWGATAHVGDCIRWYQELALVAAFAAGGEGVRLMRGKQVVAEFRLVKYN